MSTQALLDYQRIEKAIQYIQSNFKEQPDLDTLAAHVHMSPFHFQRLFSEWAGTTPKKFLQFISLEYSKHLLKNRATNLFDVAMQTGLSGTGRLHDLYISLEGMTPAEYRDGGAHLHISYSFAETPFGLSIVASSDKGLCHLAFVNDKESGFLNLQHHFPKATYQLQVNDMHQTALQCFHNQEKDWKNIKLHVKASPFQLKVWKALLEIPSGSLSTYGSIAQKIQQPMASRAVGTAIGSNPIAYLIPCHRVIQASGVIGGYMWGPIRKTAIIGWEAAMAEKETTIQNFF